MKNIATFGAGCFWGIEEEFRKLEGVTSTRVGYMGGSKDEPTYEEVCGKTTGHAEVVEITYDSEKVSYEELLDKLWEIHDPTQLNKQGSDVGSQYRSVIFSHNEEQEKLALNSIKKLEESNRYSNPIVTTVESAESNTFWEAEEYHQQYIHKKGGGTCHV